MKLVGLRSPGGLENLELDSEGCLEPRPGEILVRIRACSLNFRDAMLVQGKISVGDGRVQLSDGVGEVTSLGEGEHRPDCPTSGLREGLGSLLGLRKPSSVGRAHDEWRHIAGKRGRRLRGVQKLNEESKSLR